MVGWSRRNREYNPDIKNWHPTPWDLFLLFIAPLLMISGYIWFVLSLVQAQPVETRTCLKYETVFLGPTAHSHCIIYQDTTMTYKRTTTHPTPGR